MNVGLSFLRAREHHGINKLFSLNFCLLIVAKKASAETAAKAPEASKTKWLVRTKHDNDTMKNTNRKKQSQDKKMWAPIFQCFRDNIGIFSAENNEESQGSGSYSRTEADRQKKDFHVPMQ